MKPSADADFAGLTAVIKIGKERKVSSAERLLAGKALWLVPASTHFGDIQQLSVGIIVFIYTPFFYFVIFNCRSPDSRSFQNRG